MLTTNTKLAKDRILTFNLPALLTCPFAGSCKKYCYVKGGLYQLPAAQQRATYNCNATKKRSFVEVMVQHLYITRKKHIRIHSSGDFYSLAYLKKWIAIAEMFPDKIFYSYTKSIPLFSKVTLPSNFKVIYSFGGKKDNLIDINKHRHAKIFATAEELEAAGYANASNSDLVALGDNHKIGLIVHGNLKKHWRN